MRVRRCLPGKPIFRALLLISNMTLLWRKTLTQEEISRSGGRSEDGDRNHRDQSRSGQAEPSGGGGSLSRRGLIAGASVAGAGALLGAGGAARSRPTDSQQRLIDTMLTASASSASLSDVKHVVVLMQENRSFDHYFGTLSGVRGFSDPGVPTQVVGGKTYPVFDQFGFQIGRAHV